MNEPTVDEEYETCIDDCKAMDASINQRLDAMADDIRRITPEFAGMVDRLIVRLKNNGAGAATPSIGEPMPEFVLPDENGHLVSLSQLLETSQVVVAFHRGHWCPYCRINADAMAKIEAEVKAAGGQIVIILPETQKFTRKLKAEAGATYPILTDMDNGYALELNLAIVIDDEQQAYMTHMKWEFSEFQSNNSWIVPIPATFVIDQNGLIKGRFVDPDYRKRMDIDDLLDALRK